MISIEDCKIKGCQKIDDFVCVDEITWLSDHYPLLSITKDGYCIFGTLLFAAEMSKDRKSLKKYSRQLFEDKQSPTYISDSYCIEMYIDKDENFLVYEIGNRISSRVSRQPGSSSKNDLHLYDDDRCCLGLPRDIKREVDEHKKLESLFEKFIINFFYYQSFCEKFEKEPWKCRSHVYKIAMLQSFFDYHRKIGVKERDDYYRMWNDKLKMHKRRGPNIQCFCGKHKVIKCNCEAEKGFKILKKYYDRLPKKQKQILSQFSQLNNIKSSKPDKSN